MGDLTRAIEPHLAPATVCLALLALVSLTFAWTLHRRFANMQRLFARLTKGVEIGNIEEVLVRHLDEVRSFSGRLAALETRADAADRQIARCVQAVGLVKFDAFDDVGGRQSFSCAILDAERSGLVISGIYARSDLRVYVKHVSRGTATTKLTDEEASAVADAVKSVLSTAVGGQAS
jgi:hypothetical protein